MAQTTWFQRLKIVEWLEVPANFNLITGQATGNMNGIVAGAKVKKTDAYGDLADHINAVCGTNWTTKVAKSRYESYLKTYKETKKALYDTGNEKFMIGPKDIKMGINTLEKKREKLCSYFDRMDQLFGGRQNVVPAYIQETGRKTLEDLVEVTSNEPKINTNGLFMSNSDSELEEEEETEEGQGSSHRFSLSYSQLEQDEEEQQDALAEETGNEYYSSAANKKKRKKLNPPATVISAELKTLSANTVNNLSQASDLSRSVASMKSGSSRKSDFGSAYSVVKGKELDFQHYKNAREQENMALDLELRKADQQLRREQFELESKRSEKELQNKLDYENKKTEMELQNRLLQKKEETRSAVIQSCIVKGMTPEQINAVLALL